MFKQSVAAIVYCFMLAVANPEKKCGTGKTVDTGSIFLQDADIYDYTAMLVKNLGWLRFLLLSDEGENTEALVGQLEGVVIESRVVPCTSGGTRPSSSALQANDAGYMDSLVNAESAHAIVVVGTECLQAQVLSWLANLPEHVPPMSPLVQDTRWLLIVYSHVATTVNMTSMLVNHVALVMRDDGSGDTSVMQSGDRPVQSDNTRTVQTLMWTSSGRRLHPIKLSSLSQPSPSALYPNAKYGLNGLSLRVGINIWQPYIMPEETEGGIVYRGYSMDLLNILASTLNFTYTLALPDDMKWGDNQDGKWTGVVGQIADKEVDFSVAPLTPRLDRAAVVDWTGSMKVRYTGIAVRMTSDTGHQWMALLRPFQGKVYTYLLVTFLAYSLFLAVLLQTETRLTRSLQPQQAPSIFIIIEFLFGSFLKEIVPSSLMARDGVRRPLLAAWCVFGLLVTSCYTSKLTSLLVDVSPPPPFSSMEEMVKSGQFRWGMIGGTSLLSSFRQSDNKVMKKAYQELMKFYQEDPDVLSLDAEVHRAKMADGGYAYIGEEALLDLWALEDCAIRVIRERIVGMETYNFFTAKRSVLTDRMKTAMLQLEAGGVMDQLQAHWWPSHSSCAVSTSSQEAISLATMQTAFYIALGGLLLAAVALGLEKVSRARTIALWCPEGVSNRCR